MNIFLTGGSGFVGSNLIPHFLEQGHTVYAIARSDKSAAQVEALGAKVVRDDLLSLSAVTQAALNECALVVHSAAHMDFTYDPKPFYDLNVEATKQLLTIAEDAGVQRFIYISAAPVVPGSPIKNLREHEAGEGLPSALYPKTKAIGERAVLAANKPGFITLSLRPPTIWGANNHHLEELFDNARKGRWRWIGGSRQVLSTIHVKNLGAAISAAAQAKVNGGEAYFVTDGDNRPMRTTFGAIMKAHGIDPGEKELPKGVAVFMANLLGGIWRVLGLKSRPPIAPLMIRLMVNEFSVVDKKARDELGYINALSFEEGIAELQQTSVIHH
ncbi:MAG: NAD-dependent epimerase/dehydratase family protein [Bacteroidota bacterium]